MNGLEEGIGEYLRLRRALGFKLERDERLLLQFASHLESTGAETITVEALLAWAIMAGGAPNWHATRLRAVREFLRWAKAVIPGVEVPPPGLIPASVPRVIPYLYTDAQIRDLMHRAGSAHMRSRLTASRLTAATYSTLIGLLACTGIRVGEAIRADFRDLTDDVLTIADTKFGKTRLVPLHPTTMQAITDYRHVLGRELKRSLDTDALFVSTAGTRLLYKNVHFRFHQLVAEAGITARSSRCRPRIHDLRH